MMKRSVFSKQLISCWNEIKPLFISPPKINGKYPDMVV